MKAIKILSLLIIPLILSSCEKPLKEAPFNLNTLLEYYNPPIISFLRNEEQFKSYLADNTIFTKQPSKEFDKINAKYNASYFESHDLAAVIEQASSSMIYGYSLNGISKENNSWVISLNPLSKSKNVTCDMGAYYTYYFELEKDDNIVDAKVIFE